jgi:hypothetical protein
MELEDLFPCSKETATEPDESSPYTPILFLYNKGKAVPVIN